MMLVESRNVWLSASLVFSALSIWALWREWRQIRGGTIFSAEEQTVLGFQIIVSLLLMLSGLAWFLPSPSALERFALELVLGVSLLIIGLTSIIYRVSIVRFRGQRGPQRGGSAIAIGILVLCCMLVWSLITLARS